jgi:hypothetical protein
MPTGLGAASEWRLAIPIGGMTLGAPFLSWGAYGEARRAGYGASWVLSIGAMGSRRVAAPMAQTHVVRIVPGALGATLGAAPRPMRALHWSRDHELAPALDLFPRPFGFLSPAPASDGPKERTRAAHPMASPGGRGSFLGPPSPHAAAAVRNNPSKPLSIQG